MDNWVVVGLGNPGSEYQRTRHNVGFLTVERLARQDGARWHRQDSYLWAQPQSNLYLVEPQTYMNASGTAVVAAVRRWNAALDHVVIIYDDMDLEVGRVRIRRSGSAGGHRGMLSVIGSLDSSEIGRIRIGIGRPEPEDDAIRHVLGSFTAEQWTAVEQAVATAGEAVRDLVMMGDWEEVMSKFNHGG